METINSEAFHRMRDRFRDLIPAQARDPDIWLREMGREILNGRGPQQDGHGRDADRWVNQWFGRRRAAGFPQRVTDAVASAAYDRTIDAAILALRSIHR